MDEQYLLPQVASDIAKAINNALYPDSTLSVPGKLADAKAVGAKLDELAQSISAVDSKLSNITNAEEVAY